MSVHKIYETFNVPRSAKSVPGQFGDRSPTTPNSTDVKLQCSLFHGFRCAARSADINLCPRYTLVHLSTEPWIWTWKKMGQTFHLFLGLICWVLLRSNQAGKHRAQAHDAFPRFEMRTSKPDWTTKKVEWYLSSSLGLNSSKLYSRKSSGKVLFISTKARFLPMQR